jgi:hypothetical protein
MKIAIVLAAVLAPALAHAEEFETKSQGAVKVTRHDDLVWSLTAACDKGDDVQQRQCRVVRDRRAKSLTGVTLWVVGDRDALDVGKWNPQKKSSTVTVAACVHCGGVDVDGQTWSIVGSGGTRTEGGKLRGAVLYDNARAFPDEAAATAWTKSLASTRFELLVKVPDKRTTQKNTLAVDIVAWRVVNACDGSIVLSSVPSAAGEPDKKACAAAVAANPNVVVPLDGAAALTPGMVQEAMRPVVATARGCFAKMKVAGRAKIEITINGDGTVAKHEQTGDFVGTPTGKCIDEAMRTVVFPKTKKPTTKIGFPIVLQ